AKSIGGNPEFSFDKDSSQRGMGLQRLCCGSSPPRAKFLALAFSGERSMGQEELGKRSRRERQIMDILLRRGDATVGEVKAELADAPSYSAVRALLGILEQKGKI